LHANAGIPNRAIPDEGTSVKGKSDRMIAIIERKPQTSATRPASIERLLANMRSDGMFCMSSRRGGACRASPTIA
jgi:hypothetical protein